VRGSHVRSPPGFNAVSKHINNVFSKLGMPPSDDNNRRVLAVLTYLNA
jgi:hypothetical protein